MKPESRKGNFKHLQVRDIYRFQGFQTVKGTSNEIGDGCGIYEQFNRFTYVGFWRENKFEGFGFCFSPVIVNGHFSRTTLRSILELGHHPSFRLGSENDFRHFVGNF